MSALTRMGGGTLLVALGLACSPAVIRAPAALAALASPPDCPDPSFHGKHEIVEAGSMDESTDPCWWLSSGALFRIDGSVGRTIQGDLEPESEWHSLYAQSNPVDTDGGAHPQNLLRLVTRNRWTDYRQEVRFRIDHVNLSKSSERGEWSGVLLFLRYQDSETLYYAGLRMDGTAVIKKKLDGTYSTLAQQAVYGQRGTYDRSARPSLLPMERWIGLAAEIRTELDGSVRITLYSRNEQRPDSWQLAAEAVDDGEAGPPIRAAGHGGLRADFMDAAFSGYAITTR